MAGSKSYEFMNELHLEATELRLGLPGSSEKPEIDRRNKKRASSEVCEETSSSKNNTRSCLTDKQHASPSKAQVVGWPPIRSYWRNSLEMAKSEADGTGRYVKVSVDGAPYLRKIDLKVYGSYKELLKVLEGMFKLTIGAYSEKEGYNGSDFAPTYEDKDGDWMLVGDVPWEMFISTCKRLRIMRGSEARGPGMSPMTRKC